MTSAQLLKLRHELHQYPELSGDEKQTAKRITDWFNQLNPHSIISSVGGHGVIITFDSGRPGYHIGFRCELDALPIQETNKINYRSTEKGVSHKCGHDGHMAILAGLGSWLSQFHLPKGKVSLIFQPAEEIGTGAAAMIEDSKWPDDLNYIFALHNLPGYPLHRILTYNHQLTPTVLSIAIQLKGKTAHASEPHKGINPSLAICEIISAVCELNNPDQHDTSYCIITPVHTCIGTKNYGISPGTGETHFTLRTHTQEAMDILTRDIHKIIYSICVKYHLSFSLSESDYFPSVINDDHCMNIIKRICQNKGIENAELESALPFGEDFGFFTQKIKGAMVGLGAGVNTPPLHNTEYDFPDELIDTGIDLFRNIINNLIIN